MDKRTIEIYKEIANRELSLRSDSIFASVEVQAVQLLGLIKQAEKLSEIKELVNNEQLTKGESFDKISQIVNG